MAILPESGITVSIVKQTLASNYTDVGKLCTSENINMWSKIKPYKKNRISGTTIVQLEEDIKSAKWGLSIAKGESQASANGTYLGKDIEKMVEDAINNRLPYWVYNKPTGGVASPYRLGDFRKYAHDAIQPIRPFPTDGVDRINLNATNNYFYNVAFDFTPNTDTSGSLKIIELFGEASASLSFKDMYFGVVIINNNRQSGAYQRYYFLTYDGTFGNAIYNDLNDVFRLTFNGLTNTDFDSYGGDWIVLPFFSSANQPVVNRLGIGNASFQNGTIYPLSFALYTQTIRSYNEQTDGDNFTHGGIVKMFTDNDNFNDKLYYDFAIDNHLSTLQSFHFTFRIIQQSSYGNQNIELFNNSLRPVAPNSTYQESTGTINPTQYPMGCKLSEVNLITIGGLNLEALINSVKTNDVRWEMTFGNNDKVAPLSGRIIDGGDGSPFDI